MSCINKIFRYLVDTCTQSIKTQSPFFKSMDIFVSGCISTLISTIKKENYEVISEEPVASELLVECVELLCIVVGEKEVYDIFAHNYPKLLVDVAFVMMRTTASELLQMTKDAEQFINLALDTCDKQKSEVIKTQGAKLLESICDNIDGSVSFATQFSCWAINKAFGTTDELFVQ